MHTAAALDWEKIDTVLLDMDGTLLDLHFDNWFWLELVPVHYGAANGMTPQQAWQTIEPHFTAVRGTIEWYCIEYWSERLRLDIAHLKRSVLQRVGYLPGAEDFLRRLGSSGKRRVLVTNAHPITLALKDERIGLTQHFDTCYSSHEFAAPKEHPDFWHRLQIREPFDPSRTLFVDDSLAVLHAAHQYGIGWLRAIRRPDSQRPAQDMAPYDAVDRVSELF